ncbi:MAG TPA: hypothetical protein VKN99_09890, partial [Polyangia bacterium]|nr:hypothetical protein [Polyangia bacterium]
MTVRMAAHVWNLRRAIAYIRVNATKHARAWGQRLPPSWLDPFSSDSPALSIELPKPHTWVVRLGWRRG